MKKAAFNTVGCKVNQYDTEAIISLFEKAGYEIVNFEEKADVYVINTCTVTGLSARKSRQMIRRAKKSNSNSLVVVVGCYAQTAPREVENIPGVNLMIGTKDRSRIVELVEHIDSCENKINMVSDIMKTREFEDLRVETYKERTRAFIKIQEGCNQFCSYCIIPYARGPVRSRRPEDIISEINRLVNLGFKEVVLTGIHVASYGKDINRSSLIEIIKEVNEIEGVERIRLSSVEPGTITPEFVRTAAFLKKLCPHYHLSLQSGCDKTLERMNRKYSTYQYWEAVEMLRENIDDVALTTDIMVGFPGETDEEFEQTYSFVEKISFAKMHVFKYSPRKGTPAAGFPGQVDPLKKEERSKRLLMLSEKCNLGFNRKYIGRTMPVLFEQEFKSKPGYIEGLTSNYIKVVCKGDNILQGRIIDCKLNSVENDYINGEIAGMHE
jgi:threonylcarbamoyladenosine tRNA methylthiotransferase MtaB